MEEWTAEEMEFQINQEGISLLYLYTPMCGTCQLAGKMLEVVAKMFPAFSWGKVNLNFFPDHAVAWEVESVPCLLIFKNKKLTKKIYAFHSVPYLYELLKNMDE